MYSICILNYNDSPTTIKLIYRVLSFKTLDHVIVVDNASTDDSYEKLSKIKNEKVHIVQSGKNGGYGFGNNIGVRYGYEKLHAKYIAICNPDIIVNEEALVSCCDFLSANNNVTVAAPQMLDRNKKVVKNCVWPISTGIQYLCFSLMIFGRFFNKQYGEDNSENMKVDCVAGSLLVTDAKAFIQYGMYDENVFLFCEETILGIKLRNASRDSYLIKSVNFVHYHSVSINKSIKKKLDQKKLMWDSRLYVLKEYYKWTPFKMLFAKLIRTICLLEDLIISK